MSTSAASEFHAVDLDAVLDEFESSQTLEAANETTTDPPPKIMTRESVIDHETSLYENSANAEGIKPNILEDLKTAKSPSPDSELGRSFENDDNIDEVRSDEQSNRFILHEDEIKQETASLTSNPQPDVLSGLENVTISQHLENPDSNVNLNGDESPNMSKSSSSEFESVYDKYGDKSDDEQNPAQSAEMMDNVVFQPVQMSNEELEDMLENLENENPMLEEQAIACSHDAALSESEGKTSENLGARPKEFPIPHINNHTEVVPDIVMDTAGEPKESSTIGDTFGNDEEQEEDSIPKESPPPYSEIDPLKKPKDRPDSLDIPAEHEQQNVTEENSNDLEIPEGGPPGSTPANPNGPSNAGIPESLQGLNEDQLMLGKVAPFWVPDSEALNCMICDAKFTLVKRRHHCRGCGHVLCSVCCSDKFPLSYLEGKEGRVCKPCKNILERLAKAEGTTGSSSVSESPQQRPNPANPMEYCSTIPPHQQVAAQGGASSSTPSVMVPVGVLKGPDTSNSGEGSRPQSDPKSVVFSDGIRPGGDLTELDGQPESRRSSRRSGSRGHKKSRSRQSGQSSGAGSSARGPVAASDVAKSLIPNEGLPYVSGVGPVENDLLVQRFQDQDSVPFTLNRNLRVYVKLVHYSPVSEYVWNFKTQGMTAVGQDEFAILLVKNPDENVPPRDIFEHLQSLYEQAGRGCHISDMGYSVILSGSQFLGSTDFGGFLFFRHTFQYLDGLDCPNAPFLFGVLITRWEMSWARIFPLRLLLRLGADSRYYPTPLWSWRDRTTVYKEIGQTIMQVLCDFRNFTYSLPIIRGMLIHMEDKLTTVLIPQNSYPQIQKALEMSNTPVLALGGNFSPSADSHLVAVQRDDDEPSTNPMNNSDYETQAINIQNKERKVTGASFIVLSGALKTSSGLTAKSSIVDDGIMVQVSQDRMMSIRKSLNNMENIKIDCGPVGVDTPDETVHIKWVDADHAVNAGIKSLIDASPMDGITSIRMSAGGTDYMSGDHLIRWTEVFLLPSKTSDRGVADAEDPARAAGHLARAICMALTPHLGKLKEADLTPLAVRVNLDPDSACYEAGSNGKTLPPEFMNNLDNELVPIIHGQSSTHAAFEFVFHILDL